MVPKVWMRPPNGGEAKEVEARAEVLTPLMVLGWSQCEPPAVKSESEPRPPESGPMEVDDDAR